MPLYEFYCKKCDKKFEELMSGAVNSTPCPGCGKESGKVFSLFRTAGGSAKSGSASSGSCGG